jgi:hypothetical protein
VTNSKPKRRLNPLDAGVLSLVVMAAISFAVSNAGYAGVDKVIEGTSRVSIDVYLVGLKTLDTDIFKVGDKSAITIRNRPVKPPMTITAVKHWQREVALLSPDGKSAVAYPDPANPFAYDFLVTVEDEAERTADGYVIRGNKIKVGNLIEVEGFKYRVQGVVVDIKDTNSGQNSKK